MQYWLLKSEPDVWSLDQQKKSGANGVSWDGVRNYQAANNLQKMKIVLEIAHLTTSNVCHKHRELDNSAYGNRGKELNCPLISDFYVV